MAGLEKVAADIRGLAKGLREIQATLDLSADMIVKEVRGNIDRGQSAGEFRAVSTPDADGGKMRPLAEYTKWARRRDGIPGEAPLKATGKLYASIGVVLKSKLLRRIGAKGSSNKLKLAAQMGTITTGIKSTDLNRDIPARNPMGYSRQLLDKLLLLWYSRLSLKGNTVAKVDVRIDL